MFLAALISRSWSVPHAVQVHDRTCSGFGPSFAPHAEQVCDVGSNRPVRRNSRPYSAALQASIEVNDDHPASCTDLASRVRPRPDTARSSAYTAWFSRMMAVESLWRIDPAVATGLRQRLRCRLDHERGEEPPGRVPDHRHRRLRRHYRPANRLWSPSYFAGSPGGPPITALHQYTEQHNLRA
jgi:hypothetical protein